MSKKQKAAVAMFADCAAAVLKGGIKNKGEAALAEFFAKMAGLLVK